MRRIRQCRWNVETADIDVNSGPHSRDFTRRYPRDDPRHTATKEDAEKAKKEYILGKLQEYTKVRMLVLC